MLYLRNIIFRPTVRSVCTNGAKYAKKKPDPGIGRRKNLLSVAEQEDVPDFEDLESDFMEVHKSHKQHAREVDLLREREKYLIVKQKYFKEKFPNFLTWHDKEQIRYLHRTDPEEWTIERLSEGFPALPHVIHTIVRSNWTKTKQNKITNHDASVQKNWKLFKDGQMRDLPQDLVEHLKKFTNRALNLKPFVLPDSEKNTVEVKNTIGTEFSDIITSYRKTTKEPLNTENKQIAEEADKPCKPPKGDTFIAKSASTGKSVTLNELQVGLMRKVETGKQVDAEETRIMNNIKEESGEQVANELVIDLRQNKYQTSTQLQHTGKKERDISHLNYPEQISIPKSILKKGFIYKLNDCYYDDDGEFLYRVPGMT